MLDLPYAGVFSHATYFSSQVSQTRRFYHPNAAAETGLQLAVIGGGCEWCAVDFLIERKRFSYSALEFVWAGRGRLCLGRRWYDLAPGAVYLFDRTVPHIIRSDAQQPLVKYFFNFSGPRVRRLWAQWGLSPGTIFRTTQPARVVDLMNEAIDRALEGEGRGTREAAAAIEHALAICAGSRRQWRTVPEGAYATYQRCRHYLLRHYPSLPSVEAAARACSITAPYLTRLFQRYEKETPHACLHRLRMNEAMLRLQEPRVQVKGVAFGLRFKSPAHFSRAFKSFHGVLPSQVTGSREEPG